MHGTPPYAMECAIAIAADRPLCCISQTATLFALHVISPSTHHKDFLTFAVAEGFSKSVTGKVEPQTAFTQMA